MKTVKERWLQWDRKVSKVYSTLPSSEFSAKEVRLHPGWGL